MLVRIVLLIIFIICTALVLLYFKLLGEEIGPQPEFAPQNFLDEIINVYPIFSYPYGKLDYPKSKLLEILNNRNYRNIDSKVVIDEFNKDSIKCEADNENSNYINCHYCSVKREIVKQPIGYDNTFIMGAFYWMIILEIKNTDNEKIRNIQQIYARLSWKVETESANKLEDVGEWYLTDEAEAKQCARARRNLNDGVNQWSEEKAQGVY